MPILAILFASTWNRTRDLSAYSSLYQWSFKGPKDGQIESFYYGCGVFVAPANL